MLDAAIIRQRLSEATKGTAEQFYTEDEIKKFTDYYTDKWDDNTSEDVIAESFVDYWWDTERQSRRCSICGKLMREGYCEDAGAAYYCSDDCLHHDYTDEEWKKECENFPQGSYWTSWAE